MKTTANNAESFMHRLVQGEKYYCIWAHRYARFTRFSHDLFGRPTAIFHDICDASISINVTDLEKNIDWDGSYIANMEKMRKANV